MHVAIIGGGPGGLTTLKHLLEAHQRFPVDAVQVRLFEAEDDIGGTFRKRTYDEGEMVSSRQLTTFGDFRIPDEEGAGDFIKFPRYIKYLDDYADHFHLRPHINLNTRVTKVRRTKTGGHIITYNPRDGPSVDWECDAIAVCAGLHVTPGIPKIPGIERVPETIHSSQYKSRKQFGEGKNVIILGAGETSMDIALFSVTSPTKSTTICHRRGFVVVPKRTPYVTEFGKELSGPDLPPIDTIWSGLFDGAYAHPRLRNSRWQWEFYNAWNKFAWLCFDGSRIGYGQHAGGMKNLHLKKIIFVKNQRVSTYFNPIYDQPNVLKDVKRKVVDMVRENKTGKWIDISPWPTHVDEEGIMHFEKNDSTESRFAKPIKPDLVIYATGYQHLDLPFLDTSYPNSNEANVRSIWRQGDEDVAFIGFVRPQIGAIPPLTEFQAQLWTMQLLGQLPKKLEHEDWYELRSTPDARIHHGVDHESYAYQLALDIGFAPSFWFMLRRGWKVFAVWALSSNYNTNFRLEGPWKWEGAQHVMETELYAPIPRRDIIWGYIMLNALPIVVFGSLSLFYLLLDLVLWPFNAIEKEFQRIKTVISGNGYTALDGNPKMHSNGNVNGFVKA